MSKRGYLYLCVPLLLLYCIPPQQLDKELDYRTVDLSYDRSLCGRSPLPFWFHLTEPETEVLQNTDRIKEGNPELLLSLALIASGNVRKAGAFKKYHDRVVRFVEEVRPDVERENDFRKRGNLLYLRMRKEFLTADSSGELAGYVFGQSRLSELFEKGTYNCISSAMLFTILGRWFGMESDGVLTRGHAFVQITAPDGTKLEVETTSRDGFDWTHNEDFYRQKSSAWFRIRGIADQTFDDYATREIVEPYRLICHNMKNQHTDFSRMAVEDVHRLIEIRAYVDGTDLQYQKDLIGTYRTELLDLEKKRATATIRRFYRIITSRSIFMLDHCGNDSAVMAYLETLYRQLITESERQIDTLLSRPAISGADSVYGLFEEVVGEIHRLFPDDTALFVFTGKMSSGVINRIANRIAALLEKKQFTLAAAQYRSAESFVDAVLRMFPDDSDLLFQYGYFKEKKQMVLFAEKDLAAFIDYTRHYLEKVGNDTADDRVLYQNALFNTFQYIHYCTEREEFADAERLITAFAPDMATDPRFAQNIQWALGMAFTYHFEKGDWPEAIRIGKKQIEVDGNNTYADVNASNLQICYQNRAIDYSNKGNWIKAREVLRDCVADTSSKSDACSEKLKKLETEHSF